MTICIDCKLGRRKRYAPTDTERRWALRNFSDEEIVYLVESIWGGRPSIDHVRSERARLEQVA